MTAVTDFAALAGRVLLAVPFVISGYAKIAGYAGTAGVAFGPGRYSAERSGTR